MNVEAQPFNFYVNDAGIFVFEFEDLERNAATSLMTTLQNASDHFPPRLRILYDYSQSAPPTPYFLRTWSKLTLQTQFPNDTRSAYVIGSMEKEIWITILQRYHATEHAIRTFLQPEPAVEWLLSD